MEFGFFSQQIALAREWEKGVTAPIIGATKALHFDDAAGAFSVKLAEEDIAFLEEAYVPHRIVGAIDSNPPEGTKAAGCEEMIFKICVAKKDELNMN